MRILIAAATETEVAPLRRVSLGGHQVDICVTGVGMVATAVRCSEIMTKQRYDLALNAGLCGSFNPSLPPATVVHVVSDRIAELGAEDGDRFLTIHDLKLVGEHEFPYTSGQLVNAAPPPNRALAALPRVAGITVNTVHGRPESIDSVVRLFHPDVESMEGAAFMYAALIHKVPFAQLRAVSNLVERRNRDSWRIAEAIESLGREVLDIVNQA